jgi:hypothetical protein
VRQFSCELTQIICHLRANESDNGPSVRTKLRNRISASMALPVAATLFALALVNIASSIAIYTSNAALKDASRTGDFQNKAWDTALALSQAAERLNPLNGDAKFQSARIIRIRSKTGTTPLMDFSRSEQSMAYEALLKLRPHSGDLWTSHAMALDHEGKSFLRVDKSLHRASALAPYRPFVLLNDIELHLLAWETLNAADKQRVLRRIEQAIRYDPSMLASVTVYTGTDQLLLELTTDQEIKSYINVAIARQQRAQTK